MIKKIQKLVDVFLTILSKLFSDATYLWLKYKLGFGSPLNLKHPSGFNEKLNWLKLNHRNPMFTMMVDKYWVKSYVADIIGKEYIENILIHIWERDFMMPRREFFVLFSATNDYGNQTPPILRRIKNWSGIVKSMIMNK